MPLMTLVLLPPVLPLQFPLLNLSTRDRNQTRREALESFVGRLWFLL